MPTLDAIRERFGIDVRDVAGATLSGEIPFRDVVVNRLIAERLRNHAQIESVRVQPQDGDIVSIQLTPRARFMPPVRVTAHIERQPDFPHHPLLLLRWTMPGIGPLAMLAGPALSFFKALPRGITADGDRLAVDLRELLELRGLGEVVGFLRRVAVHTRAGSFVVSFEVAVEK